MALLQDEFDRIIGELYSQDVVAKEVLRRVFSSRGIAINDQQLGAIVSAIENGQELVDVQGLGESLEVTAEEAQNAFLEFEEEMEAEVDLAIQKSIDRTPRDVLKSLYEDLPHALHAGRQTQSLFEKRLYKRWRELIDRLEMLIMVAHEGGETHARDLHQALGDQSSSSNETVLADVLLALHARGCRTAREILCLLKGGYADGANARWRSLHEIAIIAHFLVQHGGDTPQRYIDHANIERWKAARQYQEHRDTLGYDPLSAVELTVLKHRSDEAVAKYGPDFKEDYGWAAHKLGKARPSFADIEANLEMSEWRPFFKLACHSVHAGSQGLFFSLGAPDDSGRLLIAGASDSGLDEPTHRTAISLSLVSVALFTSLPNLDSLVTSKCMMAICDDIGATLQRSVSDKEASS